MADPDGNTGRDGGIVIVVEKVRLIAYLGFWAIVLVGVVLTKAFADVDVEDSIMVRVFGYNNICVYFDYPPSSYVLPFLWAFVLVLLLAYIGAHLLQMRAQVQQGHLERKLFRRLCGMKLFEAITLICFTTSFAVSPTDPHHTAGLGVPDDTVLIHTVPFLLLQVGLISLAMSNTLHGIKSGYWRRLGLPLWFHKGAIVYCILFALIVCCKIPLTSNSVLGNPWWVQTDALRIFARAIDLAFMFLAAVVPMLKAAYLLYAKADRLEVVRLTPNTLRLPA